MIRDVVLHLLNEQPLLADLESVPLASDVSLICSNLRMMNGQRPIFVDDSASTFVFPMGFVRFIELPPRSLAGIARDGSGSEGSMLPVPARATYAGDRSGAAAAAAGHEDETEIDEDFLKRVRDV